jgi:hypothetical protein
VDDALATSLASEIGSSTVQPPGWRDRVRAVLRILIVFAVATLFWSAFDERASTWILQADQKARPRRCRQRSRHSS